MGTGGDPPSTPPPPTTPPPPAYTKLPHDEHTAPDHPDHVIDTPPVAEIADELRNALGLEGNVAEVIDAAAVRLGISAHETSLIAKAQACHAALYGAGPPPTASATLVTHAPAAQTGKTTQGPAATQGPTDGNYSGRGHSSGTKMIDTADIAGCWVEWWAPCPCWLTYHWLPWDKPGTRDNTLMKKRGCCFLGPLPMCPVNDTWKRGVGSNAFHMTDRTVVFTSPWSSCECFVCAKKCFPAHAEPVDTADTAGCWVSACVTLFCWTLYHKEPVGKDSLKKFGCCFLGPLPCCPYEVETHREKEGSNRFMYDAKGKPNSDGRFDLYYGSRCVVGASGTWCSRKCC
eukprot:m.54593 g.54593  ORF g.54593 m.54593 type:complete len:344 (+) comp7540_c0_seq1:111-1142(+)